MINLKKDIVELNVKDITPYEGSHKTDDTVEMIAQSIKEFGITQPISVDKNKVVVTGNGVYKAAVALGLKKIPCIILDDLSDEEIKQYRIADDKTSEFARFNEKKLRKELSYLQDPASMQPYFDQDVLSMLGMANPASPVTFRQPTQESEEKKDKMFKETLKRIDLDMVMKPATYMEYTCSKCGKLVKIKVNE